jgi:hypothetical protein
MQIKMLAALFDGRMLQVLSLAMLDPALEDFGERDAGRRGRVRALLHLM